MQNDYHNVGTSIPHIILIFVAIIPFKISPSNFHFPFSPDCAQRSQYSAWWWQQGRGGQLKFPRGKSHLCGHRTCIAYSTEGQPHCFIIFCLFSIFSHREVSLRCIEWPTVDKLRKKCFSDQIKRNRKRNSWELRVKRNPRRRQLEKDISLFCVCQKCRAHPRAAHMQNRPERQREQRLRELN